MKTEFRKPRLNSTLKITSYVAPISSATKLNPNLTNNMQTHPTERNANNYKNNNK